MLLLYIFVLVPIVFITIGSLLSAPKYKGPVSDHFDGKVFKNLNGVKAKGFKDVFKMLTRGPQRGLWLEVTEVSSAPNPPDKVTTGIHITFVNHSTFLIQMNGLNILTDPVWSKRVSPFPWAGPKRMRPPGLRMEQLPPIDVILLSHNHYDHLDLPTVKRLVKEHQPQIITPLGVGQFIEKQTGCDAVDLDWWQAFDYAGGLRVSAVPAQHFSGRGLLDRDATLWCGYVLETAHEKVYFAGDSGYGPFFKDIGERFPDIDLALIPIGAYLPIWFMSPIHTTPAEGVKIHLDVKAKQSVASHFGTFPLAYEGMKQAQDELEETLEEMKVPHDDFWILKEGEGRLLV